MDLHTLMIAAPLWGLAAGVVVFGKQAVRELRGIRRATEKQNMTLDNLRLRTRTRQADLATRLKPETEEDVLTRVGRTTRAKRVVVGGDPDSELNQQMNRGLVLDGD